MQIPKVDSVSMINTINSIQTKDTGNFAEHLASATEKAEQSKDDAKLKATCKDMEAMFLNMMMTDMRKTVQKSKLVDTSTEDMMTSMLDTEMTKNMASAGGMGLADMLYRQLRIDASAVKKPQAL
ncbi:rod-binding protein [Pelosinus sp. sgz500959]|uniref:rod-binding protein n=1 Tax=Pelosinus sp. sgz500959 TaxID=3242472 RepID=UPI00366D43DA